MECEPVLSDRGVWAVKIRASSLVMFTLPLTSQLTETV